MSKFIVLLGPPAVGKMTVGQEIAKKTNFKLFHNHLIIEALLPVFEFGSKSYIKLSREFRTRVFEEVINSRLDGILFTFVVAFNKPSSIEQLLRWIELFKQNVGEVYIIELQAKLEERLKRNETTNRLYHNQSKRDIEFSKEILLKSEQEWVMEAPEGICDSLPYLKINTDNLSPEETANSILKYFNF